MQAGDAAILRGGEDAVHERAAKTLVLPVRLDRESRFGIGGSFAEDAAQFGGAPNLAIDEDAEDRGIEPEGRVDIGVDEVIRGDAAKAQPPGVGIPDKTG